MNEIMMRTMVLLLMGVLSLVGQGCFRRNSVDESFLPLGRHTISNNVVVASRILGRIREEKDDLVRLKMLTQFSRRVSGIEYDHADLSLYRPYGLVQEYSSFIRKVAELMRDEAAPVVVIDLLFSGLKRIEHEKPNLEEWTRRWCTIFPDRRIPSIDDPRLWRTTMTDYERSVLLLAFQRQREDSLKDQVRYNARWVDIIYEDLGSCIEHQVVPYYFSTGNTNNAASAVKRFKELFGRDPTKKRLPFRHWD